MAEIKFEEFGKTISNAADLVGKKTEEFISIQKLKGQIHSAERSVEKNYKDLGEVIFRRYAVGEAVDEELAIICEEISQIQANIIEYKEEMAKKRGCRLCSVCQAEVPEDAYFCMKCGAPMPEEEKEPEPEVVTEEELAQAEDTEETVEETAEEIKEEMAEEAVAEDVKL